MIIRNNLEVDNTLTAGDIISTGLMSGSNISMTGQVTSSVLKANNRVNAPTMNASVLNGSSLNVTGSVTLQGQVNADAVSITELLEAGDIVSNGNSSLTNISASTIHSTNISGVNGSFTTLTADNLQETLIAGSNLTLVGTLINTSSNLNLSNVSAVNGFIVTFEADTIETNGINSQGIFADEADITTVRAIGIDTNTLTCLTGTITNLSSTNSSGARGTITNFSSTNSSATRGTITNFSSTNSSATRGTITNISCSNISCSLKINVLNVSGTNATFTSLTANNVQPTLTAGTGITIVGTTISSTGGTSLVAGTNIDITSGVIKTTSNVNLSNLSTDVLHSPVIVSDLITSIDGEIDILNADVSVTTPFLDATNISSTNATFTSLTTTNLNVSQLSTHNISAVNEIQASIVNASTIIAGDAFSVLSSTLSTSFYTDFVDEQKFVLKVTGVGSPSAPKLAFRTGTADALLITQSSNVSIGNHLTVTNTSGTNASFTNMTVTNDLYVNNLFNSTKNYGFLSRNGNQALGADTVAYPLYDSTGLFNTALYTNVDNTQMRVLKAGYYRINAEAAFDNVALSDRLTMRQRILINGSFSIVNGYGLCYIRTNNFGNFGSVSQSTIVLLSVNDLIRQEYSINVGNSQGFNSNFNNYITAVSQQLMVEFLG
jgi:hypothetical protein